MNHDGKFSFQSDISRRRILVGAIGGLTTLAIGPLLAACSSSASSATPLPTKANFQAGGGKPVDQMTWALFADAVAIDYAFAYDFNTNPPVNNIAESLLRMDPTGALHPNLATSWKQVDPLTYVYTLRQGVKFHDNTEMKATDAVASMKRIIDPSVGSYLASFVSNVASVTATGPYELTVKLKSPDLLWQYVPATSVGAVCPKSFLDANGKQVGKPNVGLVGTGPYKFVSWQQGSQIVLAKNDQYWNTDRKPMIQQITFKIIASEATVVEGMVSGAIDGAFNLSGKNLGPLKSSSNVFVATSESYFVHFVGLNATRAPFNDVRVRQALSYAIDKQGILSATWGGFGALSKSPSTPAMWATEKPAYQAAYDALPDFALNLDKAKALMQEAGAVGKSATILVATPHEQEEGVIIQAAAKSIGLTINLQTIPYDQLLAKIADKAHDYDGFLLEWSSDYPDPGGTLSQCFDPNNLTDYTSYSVPAVTTALRSAAVATTSASRATEMITAQKQIVEDQTWIVLFSPLTDMPMSSRLGGYEIRPLWYWDSGWAADISGV